MIANFTTKLIARVRYNVVRPLLNRYHRYRLSLSCRYYGIDLVIGKNVNFHHPVRVWGVGGRIVIKDNVSFAFDGGGNWFAPIGIDLRTADAELQIHENCIIMRAVQFVCFKQIIVGAGTGIAHGSLLLDSDVHNFTPGAWGEPGKHQAIHLGERVRICPEVTILKGVSIGNDSIIGNKSVVQKSLPDRCVAAGNPARVYLIHSPINSEHTAMNLNAH